MSVTAGTSPVEDTVPLRPPGSTSGRKGRWYGVGSGVGTGWYVGPVVVREGFPDGLVPPRRPTHHQFVDLLYVGWDPLSRVSPSYRLPVVSSVRLGGGVSVVSGTSLVTVSPPVLSPGVSRGKPLSSSSSDPPPTPPATTSGGVDV